MLTGRLVDGREAERIGLVGETVPLAELLASARRLAETIVEKSPSGIRGMKRLVNQGIGMPFDAALRFEIDFVHGYASTDPDPMEGLIAFKEKRKPRFRQD